MWVGEDQYVEFSRRQSSKDQNSNKNPSPSYPKRVPSHFLNKQQSNERRNLKGNLNSDSGQSSTEFIENSEESSSEYEPDIEVKKTSILTKKYLHYIYYLVHLIYLCKLYKYILFVL